MSVPAGRRVGLGRWLSVRPGDEGQDSGTPASGFQSSEGVTLKPSAVGTRSQAGPSLPLWETRLRQSEPSPGPVSSTWCSHCMSLREASAASLPTGCALCGRGGPIPEPRGRLSVLGPPRGDVAPAGISDVRRCISVVLGAGCVGRSQSCAAPHPRPGTAVSSPRSHAALPLHTHRKPAPGAPMRTPPCQPRAPAV